MRAPSRLALLLAAAAWACGPSSPMSKKVDAGGTGGPIDAGDSCQLPSGSNVGYVVRVVYLVPSDRQANNEHVVQLERAIRDVQLWYRDHTDSGITFQVFRPVVTTANLPNPESYYREHDSGGDQKNWFWDNVLADAFDVTGGGFGEERSVWLYYILADPDCGQIGGAAASGVVLIGENDLRGLVNEARVPICPDDQPDDYGRCRWVGGMAYLFGAALGLEAPPNLYDYPDADLNAADRALLEENRFFAPRQLPDDCHIDCSTL